MHTADHMHNVAVAFYSAIRLNANAASARDAAEIIASQVDEHDVLRIFLGIAAQLSLAGNICRYVI